MSRFRTPAWRIAASFVSWFLFTFSFLGLFQTAAVVIGLGGSCASGGAYVIETECPESVVLFAPLGIFGMFIATGIGLIFARSFGTPLYLWAWPILFVGLGAQFIGGAVTGQSIVSNILLGVMFIAMGLIPWWWVIRAGVQPFLIGTANATGQAFSFRDTGRTSYFAPSVPEGEQVAPTPGDGALALGLTVIGVTLGAWLSFTAFNAVATAGLAG